MPKALLSDGTLSTGELAAYLGIARRTIITWVATGKVEPADRRGTRYRWTKAQAQDLKRRIAKARGE